jgi:hypothetical protein
VRNGHAGVAVIGAGRIGKAVAQVFASTAHPVSIYGPRSGALQEVPHAVHRIAESLGEDDGSYMPIHTYLYVREQSTRPSASLTGVTDSPARLLGWIVEKYKAWRDNDGGLNDTCSDDFLLTQAPPYWFTTASARRCAVRTRSPTLAELGRGADRSRNVSRRSCAASPFLGRAQPQRRPLHEHASRRSLRGHRGPRPARLRPARLRQTTPRLVRRS